MHNMLCVCYDSTFEKPEEAPRVFVDPMDLLKTQCSPLLKMAEIEKVLCFLHMGG